MTGNQIAYGANVENQRHNVATEAELKRHNEAAEYLEASRLDIERRKQTALERYQERDLDLKEQYNTWYEKYQTAATAEKLDIERKLQEIAGMRADNEKQYQDAQVLLKSEENTIKGSANEEIKRHNEAQETISAYGQLLNERSIEYQNTFWRETINAKEVENALGMLRFSQDEALLPFRMYDLFTKGEKQSSEAYPLLKPLPPEAHIKADGSMTANKWLQQHGFVR